MRGAAFEQILREIAALRSLGKLSNEGLLEMSGSSGKAVARKIISDLTREGGKSQGVYFQCVGLGCHLFLNTLVGVGSRVTAEVRDALCEKMAQGTRGKQPKTNRSLPSKSNGECPVVAV
jgi:hypothetical protein